MGLRNGRASAHALRNVLDVVIAEEIARATHATIDVVQETYREEVEALSHDARITQYVDVIASRRVRLRLREN